MAVALFLCLVIIITAIVVGKFGCYSLGVNEWIRTYFGYHVYAISLSIYFCTFYFIISIHFLLKVSIRTAKESLWMNLQQLSKYFYYYYYYYQALQCICVCMLNMFCPSFNNYIQSMVVLYSNVLAQKYMIVCLPNVL